MNCEEHIVGGKMQVEHQKTEDGILIENLDKAWSSAYQSKDIEILQKVLADDWLGFTAQGVRILKSELLRAVPNNPDSDLVFDEFDFELYGSTAITRGRLTVNNQNEIFQQRYIRIYSKRNGQWQAVSVQIIPMT